MLTFCSAALTSTLGKLMQPLTKMTPRKKRQFAANFRKSSQSPRRMITVVVNQIDGELQGLEEK